MPGVSRQSPLFWPPLVAMLALLLALAATALYQWRSIAEQRSQQRIQDTLWLRQYLIFQLEDLHNKLKSAKEALSAPEGALSFSVTQGLLFRQHSELTRLEMVAAAENPLPCTAPHPWSFSAAPDAKPRLVWCQSLGNGLALAAHIDLSELLAQAPWWILQHYHAALYDAQGELLAERGATRNSRSPESRYRTVVTLPGVEWMVELAGDPPVTPFAQRLLLAASLTLGLAAVAAIGFAAQATQARLKALKALKDEVAFRRAMENSLTVGLRARDRNGTILYVNDAFCAMTGFSADELIGRAPPMPYWDPQERERTETLHRQILAGEGPSGGFEILFRRKDGRPLEALIFEAPLVDGDGDQIGWMASVIDVTEQRQKEREMEWQRSRLAAQARLITLGEMAAAIAHELNQPLLAIASYASGARHLLSAQGRETATSPAVEEALAAIERQALRAGEVVRRIRHFSRHREPLYAPHPLPALVAEVVQLVEPLARRSGVHIMIEAAEEVVVHVDAILFQQAIANLLINGIEAAAEPDAIAHRVTLSWRPHQAERMVEITLRDWGPGLVEKEWEQLGEAFVTHKPDGVGLGLWVTRSVVEAHRGQLRVERHPDGGTVATLLIPCASPHQEVQPLQPPELGTHRTAEQR
ncbi:PAS domain S-box protein [Hydrogenophilus islandicus]